MAEWTKKWRYEVKKTRWDGIYHLKPAGFLVTARTTDPKTGKRKFELRTMPAADAREAKAERERMLAAQHAAIGAPGQRQTFSTFATSLFRRKVLAGDIASAKGRERWESTLRLYLLPAFGSVYCDELRYADLVAWRDDTVAGWIKHGMPDKRKRKKAKEGAPKLVPCSPRTANGWLSILRVICARMSAEKEQRDPAALLEDFDTSTKPTHTEERPNAVPPEKITQFMAVMKERFPSHYAMTVLGFTTGLRPSSLRPLRRSGPTPDLDFEKRVLHVRRSHSMGDEVMATTKTKTRTSLPLPEETLAVLAAHVSDLTRPKQRASDLLFPSFRGGLRARSCLDKPFAEVAKEIGIAPVTPKAMRRTNKDLARSLDISDVVSKAISGHTTDSMHAHYSTAQSAEILGGLQKVAALVTGQQASAAQNIPTEAVKEAVKP